MDFLHYAWDDRLFMLIIGQFVALLIGAPRWLHTLIMYDAPSRIWRSTLMGIAVRLNRPNRPHADRKMRGRFVLWVLSLLVIIIGMGVVMLTIHTRYGWLVECIFIAYLIPIRACILPILEAKQAWKQKKLTALPALLRGCTDRDTEVMDVYGLVRVAVTYSAVAFPRYAVAPAMWYLALGVSGLFVCRLITCLADMLPPSHVRTRAFATSIHRADIFLQMIPVRLALLIQWSALLFVPNASVVHAAGAWTQKNAEPSITTHNLPIRLAAYGLDVSLGGDYRVGSVVRPEPWIGTGRAKLSSKDLSRCVIWYGVSVLIWMAIITGIATL
jgi:adenosylcobinamide-phosphate synthase